jgi:Ca2+-binding EF-hand superfamily protein
MDENKNGTIDYEEYLYAIVGEMNKYRQDLAMRAFSIMDKDGNGVIDINDIRGTYNAKFHPEVMEGKKTEDEVLFDFLDTFDYHTSEGT